MSTQDVAPRGSQERAPARRDIGYPMFALHREMDRLFNDFFGEFDLPRLRLGGDGGRPVPRVDVSETDAEFEVTAELPGIDEKDIEVSVSDDALTIKGEKKVEKEIKEKEYTRSERSYGMFERVIRLPTQVDEAKVNADYAKGVLTVHLPKTAETKEKVRKIKIAAAKAG